jgi:hypothetical protein
VFVCLSVSAREPVSLGFQLHNLYIFIHRLRKAFCILVELYQQPNCDCISDSVPHLTSLCHMNLHYVGHCLFVKLYLIDMMTGCRGRVAAPGSYLCSVICCSY